MKRYITNMALAVLLFLLTGCENQNRLYSDLSESSANDVLAELASHDIPASRELAEEGIAIVVASADIQRAVKTLNAAGLPRKERTDLGKMFEKDGIISTPFAEKARYIYSLSQELESTLSEIDGVITARVQVVLPDRVAPGEPVQPASASVFIKHSEVLDPDIIRARVRELVVGSIPGMASQPGSDSNVRLSVVFVPAMAYQAPEPRLESFGPFMVLEENIGLWKTIFFSVVGLIMVMVIGIAGMRYRRRAASSGQAGNAPSSAAPDTPSSDNDNIADILGLHPPQGSDHAQATANHEAIEGEDDRHALREKAHQS